MCYNIVNTLQNGDLMNIAIVDDESIQLDAVNTQLRAALSKLGIAIRRIDTYSSGAAFLDAWQSKSYDIVILDIYIDAENGVDIARRIRETDSDTILAFCTSSNEFASESYEVGAAYYLQKPVSEDKFIGMLKRLNLAKLERSRTVVLPDGFRCLLRHILYTEYHNHSVIFHLLGAQPHSVYMNHADAETLLLHYKNFKQVNKGCIVNFAMVKQLSDNAFTMKNDEVIPISRRRYKEIAEAYTKYHFELLDAEVTL